MSKPIVSALRQLGKLKPVNFIFLTAAGFINAVGVILMLQPLRFIDGGFSGMAEYLNLVVPSLSMAVFLLVFNLPCFLIGARKQGLLFIVYSLYAVGMYSLWTFLFQDVFLIPALHQTMPSSPLVADDRFLAAAFGGLFSGIGTGITVRYGGALDGTDVLAILFAKHVGLTIGNFELIFNIIMYAIIAFIVGSYILPMYSLFAYLINVKAVDFIALGLDKGKEANIVTEKKDKIGRALTEEFGRGVTIMQATGFYSSAKTYFIYCIVNRFEIVRLKNIVREIDPEAFVTISDITDTIARTDKMNRILGPFARHAKAGNSIQAEEKSSRKI